MTPTLEVSADKVEWFKDTSLMVRAASPLHIYFRIRTDGNLKEMQLLLPVYNATSQSNTKIEPEDALIDSTTWDQIKAQPQESCTMKADDLNPGTLLLKPIEGEDLLPAEFVVYLGCDDGCKYNAAVADAKCALTVYERRSWKVVATVKVCTQRELPAIRAFDSDYYVLPKGTSKHTLKWLVDNFDPAVPLELMDKNGNKLTKKDGEGRIIPFKAEDKFLVEEKDSAGQAVYTLKMGGVTKTITLERYGESGFHFLSNKPDANRLVGLYTDQNKLYALVQERDNVFLWQSDDGDGWEKMSYVSDYVALNRGLNVPPSDKIPLEVGGSPGIICNKTLYLIGGSRYDADFLSNSVYYYEFESPGKGFQKAQAAGFSPRMGHSVVQYDNKIYVIGGCDQFGACADVWSFSPTEGTWRKETAMKLPKERCMFSAEVYGSKIFLFGGFGDYPGKADVSLSESCFSYDLKSPGWKNVPVVAGTERLVAGGLLQLRKSATVESMEDYFFQVYGYLGPDNTVHRRALQWPCKTASGAVTLENTQVNDLFFMNDGYYSIQAATFKNVVWLCVVTITAEGDIKSAPLRYFVYGGN